jgi:hypothetical protein
MLNVNTVAMVKTSNQLQQDTTVNTVLKTNDYSKFKSKDGNRNLNELHLKRLTESVKQNDLLHANPILVNENYEIIDGQHRFNVCRQLGKSIHYIKVKGLGLQEIQILNANSKNWKLDDYIDGYCQMNLPEYCYFKNLIRKTNLGITSLLALFVTGTTSGNAMESLKTGNLKLGHKTRGLIILEWIEEWTKHYPNSFRRTFIVALVNLYNVKGYSHEKMMQKIKYQSTKLVDCTNTKTYLALLEEIYNFKERGEKLRFF